MLVGVSARGLDRNAAAHQRDQERWAAALDKMTAVLERLDGTMHSMVAKMEGVHF